MAVETGGKYGKPDSNENSDKNGTGENDEGPTELERKIIAQIECEAGGALANVSHVPYYFGDINLPRDKFMLEKIKADDGWIPMTVMLTFQRLAKLSNDPKVIAKALFHSDLMEVDESGSEIKIRRSPEYPLPELDEARRKALLERSIYCARFPPDAPLDTLLNFFHQYGPIENVIMRKYKDKASKTRKFKGSVFVTFKTKEKGQEFLDLESVKYEDMEVTRKWQSEYLAEKKQAFLEFKLKRGKKGEDGKGTGDDAADLKDNLPRGATIHLAGDFTGLTRENIRETFSDLGFEAAFINFKMGETEAYVRFGEENAGKTFLEKVGTEVEVSNVKLTVRLLEGEEEKSFLQTAAAVRNAAIKRRQQSRKSGRKGKKAKGNRGGGKRKGSPVEESPPAKKAAEA